MPIISGGGSAGGGTQGTEIGYDQITAPVTISSTTEATPTTVISCAAHVFPVGVVLVNFYAPYGNAPAGQSMRVALYEGGSEVGRLGFTALGQIALNFLWKFTPVAGSHTYTVGAFTSSTNGQIGAGTGGSSNDPPCFVRFTVV